MRKIYFFLLGLLVITPIFFSTVKTAEAQCAYCVNGGAYCAETNCLVCGPYTCTSNPNDEWPPCHCHCNCGCNSADCGGSGPTPTPSGCNDGIYCDGHAVGTVSSGTTVCGLGSRNFTCNNGSWTAGGACSCTCAGGITCTSNNYTGSPFEVVCSPNGNNYQCEGHLNQWQYAGSKCACATPTPIPTFTPTPTPTPPPCNTNAGNCGNCSVNCGSGTYNCTYYSHSSGVSCIPQGASFPCNPTCSSATDQCVSGSCQPRYCNSGVSCGACSVACGSGGTQSCSFTTHSGGACVPVNFSQACNPPPTCGAGQGCVNNVCQPVYTLSGNIFIDDNKNQIKDGEANYSGGTSTLRLTNQSTGAVTSYNTGNGTYTTGSSLVAGNYRVEYTTLPSPTYEMTYPVNGPPPFFTVTIGGSCSVGSHNAATCSGGNITNLNFGISNSFAWIQCVGGSCRNDGGFDNSIPSSATAACGGANAAISRGSSNTPGIVYSGDASYNFGGGQASTDPYNWVAGGLSYPDSFNPINTGVIRTSYDYYVTTVRQSGATIVDLTNSHCGAGGIANCRLIAGLQNGIYRANGNLTLSGPTYNFPNNKNFVILVNGNLRIETNIRVPVGSTATFSVNGDIQIDDTVGEAVLTSYTPNVEGYYSADDSFIIEGNNSCTVGVDKRFNLGGSVVVNAGRSGGTFQNNRDLCAGNLQCPAVSLIERVDFLLNSPQFIKSPTYIWQEVAP